MQIRADLVASVARHVVDHADLVLGHEIPAVSGAVVAGRILDDKGVYNQVEDPSGALHRFVRGHVVVGALGSRRALRGYTGEVPSALGVGDIVHLLNQGGVLGHCTSYDPAVGPPARVQILGSVLVEGAAATLAPGPVSCRAELGPVAPILMVAGTCMHAGKTAAAAALIRTAVGRGLRVSAAKLTGVALRRDSLELMAAGAQEVLTFADAGLPSTCEGDVVGAARGVLAALDRGAPDLIVVELGDGLLGDYHVMDLLEAGDIGRSVLGVVLSATDPVAAWGGVALVRERGLLPRVITGPATDNEAGIAAIERTTGCGAANARREPGRLAHLALQALPAAVAGAA